MLGVPREAIVEGYLLSQGAPGMARLRHELIDRLSVREAIADALLAVRPDYIEAMFGAVETRCGSVEAYFRECEVTTRDIQKLRATLLTHEGP
jgi:hypothetical protein